MTTVHALSNTKIEYAKAIMTGSDLLKKSNSLIKELRKRENHQDVVRKMHAHSADVIKHNVKLSGLANELLPIIIDDNTYTHDVERIVSGFGTAYEVTKVTDDTTFYKANTKLREFLDRISPIFRDPIYYIGYFITHSKRDIS